MPRGRASRRSPASPASSPQGALYAFPRFDPEVYEIRDDAQVRLRLPGRRARAARAGDRASTGRPPTTCASSRCPRRACSPRRSSGSATSCRRTGSDRADAAVTASVNPSRVAAPVVSWRHGDRTESTGAPPRARARPRREGRPRRARRLVGGGAHRRRGERVHRAGRLDRVLALAPRHRQEREPRDEGGLLVPVRRLPQGAPLGRDRGREPGRAVRPRPRSATRSRSSSSSSTRSDARG